MERPLGEFLHIIIFIRDAPPEEHAHLPPVEGAAEGRHDLLGQLAPTGIDLNVVVVVPLVAVLVGFGSCQLDASEGAALDVALHLQDPRDELCIGGAEAHTPARHVVALRHRVELNAAVLGTGHLQDAEPLALVEDERIGIVVHHDEVVLAGKGHQPFVGLHAGRCSRGHVGIVHPHQATGPLGIFENLLQQSEVWLPVVLLLQLVGHGDDAEQLAQRRVGGIAGIGHQHIVAGVDEGERRVEDALLRAYQRQNFLGRVEVDAIPPPIEAGHGLAQLRRALRGLVAVSRGVVGHLAQLVDGLFRRRHVGAANGQTDDVLPSGIQLGHLLQLAAEVVFTHFVESFCWLYHTLLYSPNIFNSRVNGKMASIDWR